jgi:hypothetical protein
MKSLLILLMFFFGSQKYAQDIIKVGNYTFQLGETSESFLNKYPNFQKTNSIDNQLPKDVTEYNYEVIDTETLISVRFFTNNLYYVTIIDPYWSNIFTDFDPLSFGFIKTGEEIEPSGNQFKADYVIELFKKDDTTLKFWGSRGGFLEIEKSITN